MLTQTYFSIISHLSKQYFSDMRHESGSTRCSNVTEAKYEPSWKTNWEPYACYRVLSRMKSGIVQKKPLLVIPPPLIISAPLQLRNLWIHFDNKLQGIKINCQKNRLMTHSLSKQQWLLRILHPLSLQRQYTDISLSKLTPPLEESASKPTFNQLETNFQPYRAMFNRVKKI